MIEILVTRTHTHVALPASIRRAQGVGGNMWVGVFSEIRKLFLGQKNNSYFKKILIGPGGSRSYPAPTTTPPSPKDPPRPREFVQKRCSAPAFGGKSSQVPIYYKKNLIRNREYWAVIG